MKTTPETEAEIVRLHYAEHWPVGTIATQVQAHPDVVRRVLGLGEPRAPSQLRPRIFEPYRGFIDDTLYRYPKLLATRLYDMARERGYRGSVRTLRKYVALVRPRPKREAYLLTETLPGEQAQVDWAYVGKIAVPGGERAIWLFVIVLAHSCAMWAEFVIDLTVHSLCRSLVRGAAAFGGVPRQWLFDNPKVVVLERVGTAVRFHPTLLTLCAAMRVEPKLCAVRMPQHKQHHQPPPRATLDDHNHQPRLQAVGNHVPWRRMRRRARRPLRAALPSRRDPRRVLARQAPPRSRPPTAEAEPLTTQASVICRGSNHDGN